MDDPSDKLRALVEAALRDHEAALVHYTSGLLNHDWDRARDVVQEAFLKLCRQNPDAMEDNVKAWLYTVCRNRAYDLLRRDNRWKMSGENLENFTQPDPDPAESAGRQDAGREVLECLNQLPSNQQDVVRLRFQQNMSYKEIAEITGISIGQVGFLLPDAMKRLRAQLETLRKKESHLGGTP